MLLDLTFFFDRHNDQVQNDKFVQIATVLIGYCSLPTRICIITCIFLSLALEAV